MKTDLMELGATTKSSPPVNYAISLSTSPVLQEEPAPLIQVLLPSTASELLPIDAQTASWVLTAIKKIEGLRNLRRGWDSYDGLPLSPAAKKITFDALDWLKTRDLPIPNVVLTSDGTLQLEWRSKGRELEIALGEGDLIEYAQVDGIGHIEEGEEDVEVRERLNVLAEWLTNG